MSEKVDAETFKKLMQQQEDAGMKDIVTDYAKLIADNIDHIAHQTVNDAINVFQRPYDGMIQAVATADDGDEAFMESWNFLMQEMPATSIAQLSRKRREARYVVCNVLGREILRREGFMEVKTIGSDVTEEGKVKLIEMLTLLTTKIDSSYFKRINDKTYLETQLEQIGTTTHTVKEAMLKLEDVFKTYYTQTGTLKENVTITPLDGKPESALSLKKAYQTVDLFQLLTFSSFPTVDRKNKIVVESGDDRLEAMEMDAGYTLLSSTITELDKYYEFMLTDVEDKIPNEQLMDAVKGFMRLSLANKITIMFDNDFVKNVIQGLVATPIAAQTIEERSANDGPLSQLADALIGAVPHSGDLRDVSDMRLSEKVYEAIKGQVLSEPPVSQLLEMRFDANDAVYKFIGHLYLLSSEASIGKYGVEFAPRTLSTMGTEEIRHRYTLPTDLDTLKSILTQNYSVEETALHREIALMNVLLPCGVNMIVWQCMTNQGMSGFVNELYTRSRRTTLATVDTLSTIMSIVTGMSSDVTA